MAEHIARIFNTDMKSSANTYHSSGDIQLLAGKSLGLLRRLSRKVALLVRNVHDYRHSRYPNPGDASSEEGVTTKSIDALYLSEKMFGDVNNSTTTISIYNCRSVDWTKLWRFIASKTINLNTLYCSKCEFRDDGLLKIVPYIRNLISLSASKPSLSSDKNQIGNKGAIAIAVNITHLQNLSIGTEGTN